MSAKGPIHTRRFKGGNIQRYVRTLNEISFFLFGGSVSKVNYIHRFPFIPRQEVHVYILNILKQQYVLQESGKERERAGERAGERDKEHDGANKQHHKKHTQPPNCFFLPLRSIHYNKARWIPLANQQRDALIGQK